MTTSEAMATGEGVRYLLGERSGRIRAGLYAALMLVVGFSLGAFVPSPHGGDPGFGWYVVIPACAYGPLVLTRGRDQFVDLGIPMGLGIICLWLGWLLRLLSARAGEWTLEDVIPGTLAIGLYLGVSVLLFATPMIVGGVLAVWSIQRSLPPILAAGLPLPPRLKAAAMLLAGVVFELGMLLLELWIFMPRFPS